MISIKKYILATTLVLAFAAPSFAATQAEINLQLAVARAAAADAARQAALDARYANPRPKGEALKQADALIARTIAEKQAAGTAYWAAKHAYDAEVKALAAAAKAGNGKPNTGNAQAQVPQGAMVVGTTQQLVDAIKSVKDGASGVIVLRAGTYDYLNFKNRKFASLQVMGMPGELPLIKGMRAMGTENLTLRNLRFQMAAEQVFSPIVWVSSGKNISLTESRVEGTTDYLAAGGAKGIGLRIEYSENVSVTKSTLRDLYIGGGFTQIKNLTVSDNDIQELRKDGFNFVGLRGAVIANNLIDKNAIQTGDHPDHIQFWGKNDAEYSSDVLITGNRMLSPGAQGVFMRCYNDCPKHTYKNIVIKDNYITNGAYNGIVLSGGTNIRIENNVSVIRKDPSTSPYSAIRASQVVNLTIKNNISNGFAVDKDTMANTLFSGNKIVRPGVIPANIPSLLSGFAALEDVVMKADKTTGNLSQTFKN